MIKLICDKLPRITKNRKKLEKVLGVKITNRGTEVYINGLAEDEYVAEKTIEALNFGFPFSTVLLIREEEFEFEIIPIKNHTHRKDLERIRARIIGKKGKTLRTLSNLTDCYFEIKDNCVGIIGDSSLIKNASTAVISIIKGTKQANVYAYLEKHHPRPELDLGLKIKE